MLAYAKFHVVVVVVVVSATNPTIVCWELIKSSPEQFSESVVLQFVQLQSFEFGQGETTAIEDIEVAQDITRPWAFTHRCTPGIQYNVGIAIINHPFLMVHTTHLW